MASSDYKLKFQIEADAKKAKAELNNVDGLIKKLGANQSLKGVISSASSELSTFGSIATKAADSIPIPFAAAAVAITGVGLAAVNAGSAFFTLVRNASDFGSELHDAADKTGLSAEAISTLKFNADNAGSSLEKVSGGVAKFGKLLGQAADGSEKAQTTLKSLGITSNDLQTAMDQAFVSIEKLPPGIEQLAASQKLFGKTGADMIPVIKQMGGSFTDAITEAKRFGVTLSEEDLKAADNFGDSLKSLGVQAKVMASKFALEFAPMITSAMNKTSKAISDHQDDIRRAASNFENAARGMIGVSNDLAHAAGKVQTEYQKMPTALQKTSDGLAALIIPGYGAVRLMQKLAEATAKYLVLRGRVENSKSERGEAGLASPNGRAGDGLNRKFGYVDPDEDSASGGKSSGGGGGGGGGRAGGKSTAEQKERERIQGIKRHADEEIAIRVATDQTVLAAVQQRLAVMDVSEQQAAEQTNRTLMAQLQFRRDTLAKELAAVKGNAEEEKRIKQEQKLLEQEILKFRIESATSVYELAKKGRGAAYDALVKEIDKYVELREELTKTLAVENERFDLMVKQQEAEGAGVLDRDRPGTSKYNPGFGGQVSKGLGEQFGIVSSRDQNGEIKSQAQFLKDVYADMADGITQSIGMITGAMSDMLVQMIVSGQVSGKAALQMAAGVALGLAIQAGIKAIFEVAEGMAAAANPLTAALAPAHFLAAKMYGVVAAVAGGAGVGLALGARAMGGGSGSKSSSKSSPYGSSSSTSAAAPKRSEDLTPYSRQTKDAFISGRHDETAAFVVRALDRFDQTLKKFDPMRPGDVLVAGTRQKPGHIGQQVVKDISGNAGIGRTILQKSGVR